MKTTTEKKGEKMKVEFSHNTRGMVSAELGRKTRNKDRYKVILKDDQGRVYETKEDYSVATIKKYFNAGRYVIFTRDQNTGKTKIKRVA